MRPLANTPLVRRALLVCVAAATLGCGGSTAPATTTNTASRAPIGTSGAVAEAAGPTGGEPAIELSLRTVDGTFIEIGELRGSVVMLYFFATFDGLSQAVLRPLSDLAEAQPELRVVGVAAQPNARVLLDAYVHALEPPFPVAYDPLDSVTDGTSAFGTLPGVPTLVTLDAQGRVAASHAGFADRARLEEMCVAAGLRLRRR